MDIETMKIAISAAINEEARMDISTVNPREANELMQWIGKTFYSKCPHFPVAVLIKNRLSVYNKKTGELFCVRQYAERMVKGLHRINPDIGVKEYLCLKVNEDGEQSMCPYPEKKRCHYYKQFTPGLIRIYESSSTFRQVILDNDQDSIYLE